MLLYKKPKIDREVAEVQNAILQSLITGLGNLEPNDMVFSRIYGAVSTHFPEYFGLLSEHQGKVGGDMNEFMFIDSSNDSSQMNASFPDEIINST